MENANILYAEMHNLDVRIAGVQHQQVENEYVRDYVLQLAEEVSESMTRQQFTTREDSDVINKILEIKNNHLNDEEEEDVSFIARKLHSVEQEIQIGLDRLHKEVKKGSLIEALIEDSGKYYYVISKVDSDKYLDQDSLVARQGLRYENKAFKNCLVRFDNDERGIYEIFITDKNDTKYWHNDFLEIDKCLDDKDNTGRSYKIIHHNIKRKYKNDEQEFFLKKQQLNGYFKTHDRFDLDEAMNYIFGENDSDIKSEIREKALSRSREGAMDTQFTIDNEGLKRSMLKYQKKINDVVELVVEGVDADIKNSIKVFEDENSDRWMKIKVTSDEAFETFDWED